MKNPLTPKLNARFRLAVGLLIGLTASQSAAESQEAQFGLANLLPQAEMVQVVRSAPLVGKGGVSDAELETPARRHSESYRTEASAVQPPQDVVINWREIRERAARASEEKTDEAAAAPRPNQEHTRPHTARDRLLFGLTPVIPASKPKERTAPSVSDLGTFRARALASDTSAPLIAPHDFPRHDDGPGRTKQPQGHMSGYAQP